MSVLERTSWVDRSIDLMIHDIIEYDMKDGGLSVIKEEKLLPPSMIARYDAMPKGIKRNASIALLKRSKKYHDIPKQQTAMFQKYRIRFGEANELTDEDILAVRKDAIFTKRFCYTLDFGDYIHFAEKNVYQLFWVLNVNEPNIKGKRRLEFYWSEDGTLDVKGMKDSTLKKHEDYILQSLWRVGKYVVQYDREGAIQYLSHVMNEYKFLRLDVGYYRGLNDRSIFPVVLNGRQTLVDDIGPELLPMVDISYNYLEIYANLLNLISQSMK